MKKREDINSRYKWRLEDIYHNETDWQQDFDIFNKRLVEVLKYKGKLENKKDLLACLKFSDEMGKLAEKLYCYAMLYADTELSKTKPQEYKSRIETAFVQFNSYSSFITPELSSLDDEVLQGFISDSNFSSYDYMLSRIKEEKQHILSEGEEKLIALSGKMLGAFSDIFSKIDNVDLDFPTLTIDGKKVKLTHGSYGLLLQHKDAAVRKKVFSAYYKTYEKLINTIGENFAASVNKDNFLALARNYQSALEKSLKQNVVPVSVYTTLLENTTNNLPLLHDYMKLRKQVLGLDELTMSDLHVPLFEKADLKLEFDEAYDLVIQGLKPMGFEYTKLLQAAKEERWCDVFETENKRSGAYSCGVYGVHPFILLNYKKTTNDIFTIAHELGHAIHSFYSSKHQPYTKNDYSIFVAEVASTVNEVLLIKHLLKTADKKLRQYLLAYYLDMFRTTLFRQTMFASFEADIHSDEQRGVPLTVAHLSKSYASLNRKYHGEAVLSNRAIRFEWARIPHFYRAFYVYQYATGLISAVNIAGDILSGNEKAFTAYKKFLSAGGSKSPFEILRDSGVDLLTEKPYTVAFGEFRKTLEELKASL